MPGWPFRRSRSEQARRAVQRYLAVVSAEPADEDVAWLASTATTGDADRARWELRYARRVIGLLVAERDALDDRTASLVAHEMRQALQMDRNVAAGMVHVAERQLNERLRSYRAALAARSAGDSTETRLARVLLASTSPVAATAEAVRRAGEITQRYLLEANAALRGAFGAADLPDDEAPSIWRMRQSR